MSNIQENLQKILTAVWGRDVRQAIHDAIHDCYEDASSGTTDLPARERIDTLEANSATKTELQAETTARTTGDANINNIIGSVAMGTTAVTLKGAIKELLGKINTNVTNIGQNTTNINNLITKVGNVAMGTTATTVTGAIKELKNSITALQTKPPIKYYWFSTGSRTWAVGSTTYSIRIPATPSGYDLWALYPRTTINRDMTFVVGFASGQLTLYVRNASSSAVTCDINGFAIFLNRNNALTL